MRVLSLIALMNLFFLLGCHNTPSREGPGQNSGSRNPQPGQCTNLIAKRASLMPRIFEPAQNFDFDYRGSDGSTWTRHGRNETKLSRRLLLVIDEPADHSSLQTVVFRRSFAENEIDAFNASLLFWQTPSHALQTDSTQHPSFLPSGNSVWPIHKRWDAAAEADYNKWVATRVDVDLLSGSGLAVDCADFAMTIRWIYARDHGLPAADTLEGSGRLFGSWQSSTEWDRLPTNSDWKKDERFKAALSYVLENSYTHTIVDDLYPVTLTPEFIKAGTIYLTWHGDTGHTRTLLNVGLDPRCDGARPCFVEIYGNLPKSESGYLSVYEIPERQDEGQGGLMRFRWPVTDSSGHWQLALPQTMPGFSREQFVWNEVEYSYQLADRLKLFSSKEALVANQGLLLARQISERYRLTAVGYYFCSLVPCAQGSEEDDAWSTPSRDSRTLRGVQSFQALMATVDQSSFDIRDMVQQIDQPIYSDAPINAWELMSSQSLPNWNPDPRVDVQTRWGLVAQTPGERARFLAQIMYTNWQEREWHVATAVSRCGQGSPRCKPGTAIFKFSETTRYDKGFRIALKDFSELYAKLAPESRSSIDGLLKSMQTSVPLCDGGCASHCSMYDFMIAHPEHIEKMTSNPPDSLNSRYGF